MTEIQPEKGITYLCRVEQGWFKGRECELTWTGDLFVGTDVGVLYSRDVTIIRPVTARITDEGGHWEECDASEVISGDRRRGTIDADDKVTWERWVPDAPPVVIPDKPDQDGIASGVTVMGIVFTDRPAWTVAGGDVAVRLPNGEVRSVVRADVTAWQDAELRAVES